MTVLGQHTLMINRRYIARDLVMSRQRLWLYTLTSFTWKRLMYNIVRANHIFLVLVFGGTNFRIPECFLGIFTQLRKQSQTKFDSKLIRVTVPVTQLNLYLNLCA